jgi:hypothetical protein
VLSLGYGGLLSDRWRGYIQRMTMKNFFIALLLTGVFLGILVIAGTAQNEGCLPWKDPITVGGSSSVFSENRGETLCR